MTERKKLTINRPRKASQEEHAQSNPVYRKKVWVNTAPKKRAKKPHPPKVVKPKSKEPVTKPKQEVKVKIPKPPTPPKKRLPLEEAISQITTFWPNLFPENQLRPMKIGIQQDMWQEVKEKGLPLARRRLRACLGSIGHHADYRAVIQLGAFRYNKKGQIAGEVTQADVEDNLQRFARRNKSNHQSTDCLCLFGVGKMILAGMKRNSVVIYLVICCSFSVGADWVIDLMGKIRKSFLIYLPELHCSAPLTDSVGKEKNLIIG